VSRGGGGRAGRAAQQARRAWPFVLMAWRRWESLPPERKEQYKRQAREYAQRGREAASRRRRGR
jgi:hypothetical protein